MLCIPYKTQDEEEENTWENHAHDIYRKQLNLKEEEFKFKLELQYEDTIQDDQGLMTGLSDKIKKTKLDLFSKDVILGDGAYGRPRPVGAAGVAKVVNHPEFPECEFFRAGRLMDVIVRHNNLTFEDDAMADGRVVCVKLRGEKKHSCLDFIMYTGRVAPYHNAATFHQYVQAFKKNLEPEIRDWALERPASVFGRIESVRRNPSSYCNLRYHSHVTYTMTSSDGGRHWVRVRLRPVDDEHETGRLTAQQQKQFWIIKKLKNDMEQDDHLRKEFNHTISKVPIQYMLQFQVKPTDESVTINKSKYSVLLEDAHNPSEMWDAKKYPWMDVMIITLTTPITENDLVQLPFTLDNHLPSFQIKDVSSMNDFLSLALVTKTFHGVPVKPAEEAEMGFSGSNTKTTQLTIVVTTGGYDKAGTDADVYISLIGVLGRSGCLTLNNPLQDNFEKCQVDTFHVNVPFIGEVHAVELDIRSRAKTRTWFVESIDIEDATTKKKVHFSCSSWLVSSDPVMLFRKADVLLPQKEIYPCMYMYRKRQVQRRRCLYDWEHVDGLPGRLKTATYEDLPKEMKYPTDKDMDVMKVLKRNLSITKRTDVLGLFDSWDVFSDAPKVLGSLVKDMKVVNHTVRKWNSDKEFGRQLLNGAHPLRIQLVTSLPAGFENVECLIDSILKDTTLEEAIEDGYIYSVSYPELEHLDSGMPYRSKSFRYFTCPTCLLYVREDGNLVPVAIRLYQPDIRNDTHTVRFVGDMDSSPESSIDYSELDKDHKQSKDNGIKGKAEEEFEEVYVEKENSEARDLIWTPRDGGSEWEFAKMWVKQADVQVHQVVSRQLRVSLPLQVFTLATYRTLPPEHPVYKILTPHIQHVLASSLLARQALYSPPGQDNLYDRFLAVGGQQEELLREAYKTFSLDDLYLPRDLKHRGVMESNLLPNYHYRDYGLLMWNVIYKFMRTIVWLQYWTDTEVQADQEIQQWIYEIHDLGFPAGEDGFDHDVPSHFCTLENLVEFMTMIVFTASCQNAALTLGSMDYYGFIPNSPTLMLQPPPRDKRNTNLETLKTALPGKAATAEILAVCNTLGLQSEFQSYLGEYPAILADDRRIQAAIDAFQEDLLNVADVMTERNASLDIPYTYLLPTRMAASPSI